MMSLFFNKLVVADLASGQEAGNVDPLSDDRPASRVGPVTPSAASADRARGSSRFLLRLWREPGIPSESDQYRGYLRNLKTGEERYFGTPEALSAEVLCALKSEHDAVPGPVQSRAGCNPPSTATE